MLASNSNPNANSSHSAFMPGLSQTAPGAGDSQTQVRPPSGGLPAFDFGSSSGGNNSGSNVSPTTVARQAGQGDNAHHSNKASQGAVGGENSTGSNSGNRHSDTSNTTAATSTSIDPATQTLTWAPTVVDTALPKPLGVHSSGGDIARILTKVDGRAYTGFSFPSWKKWSILTAIFVVQLSMNFNASVYANGFHKISERYSVSVTDARQGQLLFLIMYGIGSELWAPWSEELGRWPVLQSSLLLVNLTQLLCAYSPTFAGLIAGRCLGGLFSAGGSVTLGMVADMWDADTQQYAVAYVVLSSVAGSALGPIFGGLVETYLPLRWIFYIELIFGVTVQAVHFWVPETRESVLLAREAKRRRKAGGGNWRSETDDAEGLTVKKVFEIWARPFIMFVREPIVLFLSLLSGFSDALIFTFLESFRPVLVQWGFGTVEIGLSFVGIINGYIVAYIIFIPDIRKQVQRRKKNPGSVTPERRLWLLMFLAPLEPIGLFGFAWTSSGPPVLWIIPLFFAMLIAIANYAIYMATIDYMIEAYGAYSASATGGNALARDVLAGLAALYSASFYEKFPQYTLQLPSTILGVLAALVLLPVYVCWWYGPTIRAKSKFAVSLAAERERVRERQVERAEKRAATANGQA